MNDFEDSYKTVPLRIVIGSFFLAMLLDFMPFPFEMFFWLPEITALTLLYWVMNPSNRIGMGAAFLVGLLVDVGTATSLGLHALSYTAMVFFVLRYRRQIMLYGHVMQIIMIAALLLCNQTVLVVARLFLNRQIITLQSFIAPIVGALLWPLYSQLLQVVIRPKKKRR